MVRYADGWARTLAAGMALLVLGVGAHGQDAPAPRKNIITLSAEQAYEQGMGAFGVQCDLKTRELTLYDHVVIEDDGPGIASTVTYIDEMDRAAIEEFSDKSLVKKVLRVDRPEAVEVELYSRTSDLPVRINGQIVNLKGRYASISPSLLKKGDNEFIFGEQAAGQMWVARLQNILKNAPERKDGPRRSFRSTDGGKTWEPLEGECLVRLILRQYAEEGTVISPVIDLARVGDDASLLQSAVSAKGVAMKYAGDTPAGTRLDLPIRTGSTPVYDPRSWSDWATDPARIPEGHRYLQWKAVLRTANPTVTPILRSVTVEAQVAAEAPPPWAAKVKVESFHNEQIRYTSMPFEYEDPSEPKLVALREKYKLDDVVSGAGSEFERLLKLKDWVSRQWKYKPPEGKYPAWDADEIMQRKLGFCVQYAIVFVQCAASLGHHARFVFGDHPGIMHGHEISEVWSNEYGKWIALDANANRHYFDPTLNVPLSMLEVHRRMVKHYYGDKMAIPQNKPKEPSYADNLVSAHGLEMVPPKPKDEKPKNWPAWTKWLTMHYVPRNNFYSKPALLPVSQGWGWDWPYYWCWYDAQTARKPRYHHLTTREADLEWTLNQVRFDASYGPKPGTLDVQMGTVTPYFETFLINVDGKGWQKSDRRFAWSLHDGRNRLEMRVRNTAGVEGRISFVELDYR